MLVSLFIVKLEPDDGGWKLGCAPLDVAGIALEKWEDPKGLWLVLRKLHLLQGLSFLSSTCKTQT